jgi:hypothetical protein
VSLAAVESAATAANIPPLVMEELRSAVDHCWTTLWAALLATQTTYEGTSAIVVARIHRVQEMCGRIREDVTEGQAPVPPFWESSRPEFDRPDRGFEPRCPLSSIILLRVSGRAHSHARPPLRDKPGPAAHTQAQPGISPHGGGRP